MNTTKVGRKEGKNTHEAECLRIILKCYAFKGLSFHLSDVGGNDKQTIKGTTQRFLSDENCVYPWFE